jgi:uncharacterized membrane protein
MLLPSADNPILFFFNFVGSLVCHQLPERTLRVGDRLLPVCARCTGAYIGLFLGYFLVPMRRKNASGPPDLLITSLMLTPMIIDAGTQWIGFRNSTNEIRLITGLLFGIGAAPLLVYLVSLIPASKRIPILRNFLPKTVELDSKNPWLGNRFLGLGVLIGIASYFIIDSLVGSLNTLFYWLLSSIIIASVVWHIFLLPVFLVVLYVFSLRTKKS